MADRDDELARTATAPPGSSSAPATPVAPIGPMLGRYRLERELGQGGMGVVHAAFDPDLERRIALKVLRTAETGDARGRLLREARAMARLAHPNVVTVHEVGSAAGRDYVAMELIHGETLADWLRATPRDEADVLAAFVGAGRGLAAAHAAGIVHRDFKPHNVLRSKDGRIVVTDFGLAREAEPDPLTATMPMRRPSAPAITESTPSSLSGLTQTGSVLGTPAYMAPEQWSGGAVTPATDQFAYCVAMWEALAGERPYRAATAEELREEVCLGPSKLDASKLPRRLRRILRRGLDPAPARRWPHMDALLVAIARAERRPGVALAIGGAAIAAAAIAYFALRPTAVDAVACVPPPREPASVWSPQLAGELAPPHAAIFARDFDRWQAARRAACTAPEAERAAQLHCLDRVLLRFDAVRRAVVRVAAVTEDDVAELLVEPTACMTADPPRLLVDATADVATAFELYARTLVPDAHPPEADVTALLERPSLDSCARAIGDLAMAQTTTDVPKQRAAVTDALSASEQCNDDHLRAEALVHAAPFQFELPLIGPKGLAAIQRADVAAKRVGDADLMAPVEMMRALVASQQENWVETFAAADRAITSYHRSGLARRELGSILELDMFHFMRDLPADHDAVRKTVDTWLPIAKRLGSRRATEQLQRDEARLAFFSGRVADAHAELMSVWRPSPLNGSPSQRVEGTVVDRAGKPVANATVAVASRLASDAVGIGMPGMDLHRPDFQLRIAITDASGAFAFTDAPTHGSVLAQLGAERSLPLPIAEHVKLVLAPTRTVRGKIALGSEPATKLLVSAAIVEGTNDYNVLAPVAADGTFVLAGVADVVVEVSVTIGSRHFGQTSASKRLPAGTADVADLALALATGGRTLDVIARSSLPVPLDFAQILLFPGKLKLATVRDLMKLSDNGTQTRFAHAVVGEKAPAPLLGKLRPGDLVVHFEAAPPGDLTACIVGLNGDMLDPTTMGKIQAHIDELAIKCEQVPTGTPMVVLEAPPQKRFD